MSAVAARESDDDTVTRSSEGSDPRLHRLRQIDEAGDPPLASGWLKPAAAQPTARGAPMSKGRLVEERPESTLSQPFGDYSKDSLEGVCGMLCMPSTISMGQGCKGCNQSVFTGHSSAH